MFKGKVVVITGGSDGIGKIFTEAYFGCSDKLVRKFFSKMVNW
jgi:NAD(P)-dependent dehydrogenase (short-subunit alcohol dehydrogenase family)